jgi:hypothetical protein
MGSPGLNEKEEMTMARERIRLIPEEEQTEVMIRRSIETGEINQENFSQLPPEEQKLVSKVLFEIASEKVNPTIGASVLEFILFAFIRLANKKLNGMSLTAEDVEVEQSLQRILDMHQITDGKTPKKDWLFDYMKYAEEHAGEFLKNRQEHVERKKRVIGKV